MARRADDQRFLWRSPLVSVPLVFLRDACRRPVSPRREVLVTEPKTARSRPKQPKASETPGERLKRSILAEYELSPAERLLLEEAAALADVLGRLNAEIAAAQALTGKGSKGQTVASPLLAAQRQHCEALVRVIEGLALPALEEDEGELSSSKRARKAATVRWMKEVR
jgi:hypothetical protein